MADGTTKPIKDIKPGDQVTATDPENGQTQAEPVTAIIIEDHQDRTLVDLTVTGDTHTTQPGIVTATDYHPFWDPDHRRWVQAGVLRTGDRLRAPDGRLAVVVSAQAHHEHDTPLRNLTVEHLHTYYVIAGNTPVLVHNSNGLCGSPQEVAAAYRANAANGVGARRNIAVAQYDIDGGTGQLIGVSGSHQNPGSVGPPKNPIFDPSGRVSDSEWQVLENLAEGLTPRSSGTVNLYSERPVCPSCQSVIRQFQERFPGVKIHVTTG